MAIYKNISRKEYVALEGINASTLKNYLKSIRHGNYKLANPIKTTPAMAFGTMVHKYILEHDDFYNEYAIMPTCPEELWLKKDNTRYIKKPKAVTEWEDNLPSDKIYVSHEEMLKLNCIRDNLDRHDEAVSILDNAENRETAVTWVDKETGIKCKALIDYWGIIAGDLKTTKEIKSANHLVRTCLDFGYDIQFAFYSDGLKENGIEVPFTVIFAESGNEYDIAPFDLSDDFLSYGRERYRKCLANWEKRDNDIGLFPTITTLDLPKWAKGE